MSNYQFWPAPAKLNLFLHITKQREDGYHELQTVFQFINMSDRLRFVVNDSGVIKRKTDNEGIKAEDDLVVKAAQALQSFTATSQGVDIYLQKLLPLGGGVGGGSSDAATTLVALNYLWETELALDDLMQMGLKLGADVPVFIQGKAAFAEGVGEKLTPINPLEPWYLVVQPEINVSTAQIFNDSQLTRDCSSIRICDLQIGTPDELLVLGELGNGFEPIVAKQHPEIAEVINYLGQYSKARLTGTGACVFCAFYSKDEAEQVLATLPDCWAAYVVKGLTQSPLQVMLEALKNDVL